MTGPDWSRTSADYARHRQGFPDGLYDLLAREGLLRPGIRALDLGTGTGTGALARGLAARGADVLGLDPAPGQVTAATRLAAEQGLSDRARFIEGVAERTDQPGGSFDLVAAGQAWHWFERGLAAAEAMRVLKPGGALLICHFDWIPLPANVAHATEWLIEAHNPHWRMGRGTGFYPAWATDLALAGFRDIGFGGFDHEALYSREDWRGRIRASAGVGGAMGGAAVARFDAELAAMLDARFPQDPLVVPHRVFAIWGWRR